MTWASFMVGMESSISTVATEPLISDSLSALYAKLEAALAITIDKAITALKICLFMSTTFVCDRDL